MLKVLPGPSGTADANVEAKLDKGAVCSDLCFRLAINH
jgi:hypothetical protein